jgi:hypothetical protein
MIIFFVIRIYVIVIACLCMLFDCLMLYKSNGGRRGGGERESRGERGVGKLSKLFFFIV